MNVEAKRVKHFWGGGIEISTFGEEPIRMRDIGSKWYDIEFLKKKVANKFGNDFARTLSISISGQKISFSRFPVIDLTGKGKAGYDTSKHRKFINFLKDHYESVNVIDGN